MWHRLTVATAALSLAATLAGCGSGDSTVAKTPQPSQTSSATPANTPPSSSAAPPTASSAPAAPASPDPCEVNLAAPAIAQAVSELPRDPRSGQGWYPVPIAGNFNECAQLSAVIIRANTNAENPNTRAVMFHLGKYVRSGVPDTFGFNAVDTAQSTGDTVALVYLNPLGLQSVVKFRWNGNGVELIGNTG